MVLWDSQAFCGIPGIPKDPEEFPHAFQGLEDSEGFRKGSEGFSKIDNDSLGS